MSNKYSFSEFLAAQEGRDFDVVEESWLNWSDKFVNSIPDILFSDRPYPQGTPGNCPTNVIAQELQSYLDYYYDEEKWRKENL